MKSSLFWGLLIVCSLFGVLQGCDASDKSNAECQGCNGKGVIAVQFTEDVECFSCRGKGVIEHKENYTCASCKGRGTTFCRYYNSWKGGYEKCDRGTLYRYSKEIEWMFNPNPGYYLEGSTTCYKCNGTSYADCEKCGGYGNLTTTKEIEHTRCKGTGLIDTLIIREETHKLCNGKGVLE